jgi:hypothetical protein
MIFILMKMHTLTRYFDAIKRSLSNSSGHDEIKDIEMRVSELLNEKLVNDKQVVGLRDVDGYCQGDRLHYRG